MTIQPIDLSDFSLVEVKTDYPCEVRPTSHCKLHGAMNKITIHEDGGGIWRCIHVPGVERVRVLQSNGSYAEGLLEHDSICRAGCSEEVEK